MNNMIIGRNHWKKPKKNHDQNHDQVLNDHVLCLIMVFEAPFSLLAGGKAGEIF